VTEWSVSQVDLHTKKTHIVAEDVFGLQLGDSKNDSLTKVKTG
jgi:hypothetical protein